MDAQPQQPADHAAIRELFDEYLQMYATRDDRLTTWFSENFSGFTGGGHELVQDREEWVAITRQDFAQVREAIRIELKDVAIQSLAETIATATGFFTIHLPIKDHILSRETARLVLIFRKESAGWKISHSSISIPYYLVRDGEVYPLKELVERNQTLEAEVAERTLQLSAANGNLLRTNEELAGKIEEHRQAADALRRSEDRYRSILNASPDDITITDGEGRILMVSPMALTIFGTGAKEDFIGRPITDFIVEEDRPRAWSQVALKRQGVRTRPTEYRGLRSDGSTFDIEVNSEFIRDAAGLPTGMVVIVRDITERKRAELERERLEAQNRQLQKAESLSRMAGAIAHHFNNQLHAVIGNLDLTLDEMPPGAAHAEYVIAAAQSARKAAEMSLAMLTYLGQTASQRGALDLSDACRRSLATLRAAVPADVRLETCLPAAGPVIRANADQIRQVLTNLVANAWEAMNGGPGSVFVSVRLVAAADIPSTHRFPVDSQPGNTPHACLEVADTGCGISAQDIEKAFDPFFTSKFAGRGLGLAAILGIARAHDGMITVESAPGRGSVFRVFLPVSADAVP